MGGARTRLLCTVVMLACASLGCAGNQGASEPEALPGEDPRWLVRCESSLKQRVEPGEDPATAVAKGWINARTPGDYKVYMVGHLEDGFVQVENVVSDDQAWSLDPLQPYANLRKLCRQTMARRRDGDLYRPGLVRAYNPDSGIYTSYVFDRWSPRSEITRMVVFGDSLSDTGNLRRRLKLMPRNPYWAGRFANGPVWTDYLEVSPGLALQNHARGGAMAAEREPMDSDEMIQRVYTNGQFFVSGDIDDQIDDYAASYLRGGQVQQGEHTVAVLWAGANDYISKEAYDSSISALLGQPYSEDGYRDLVSRVVNALRGNLERLRELGLQRFLVVNLPDLGLTPMVIHNDSFLVSRNFSSDEERLLEFSRRLSELARWHNRALAEMVADFGASSPGVDAVLADTNELFTQVFDVEIGAGRMGFDLALNQVTIAASETERALQDRCYSGMTLGVFALESAVCASASRAVFWDLVHPSTYAHCWVAYWFGAVLHEQGWIGAMPDVQAQQAWCAMVADAYSSV